MARQKPNQPLKVEMYSYTDYLNISKAAQQVVKNKNNKSYIPDPNDKKFISEILDQLNKDNILSNKDLRIEIMKHFNLEYFSLDNMESTVYEAIKTCLLEISGLLDDDNQKFYEVKYTEITSQQGNNNYNNDITNEFSSSECKQIEELAKKYDVAVVYNHFYNGPNASFSSLMKQFNKIIKISNQYEDNEDNISQSDNTKDDTLMGAYWEKIENLNKQYSDIKFSQNNQQLDIMSYYLYCTTELNMNPNDIYEEICQYIDINNQAINYTNQQYNGFDKVTYNQQLYNENVTYYNNNSPSDIDYANLILNSQKMSIHEIKWAMNRFYDELGTSNKSEKEIYDSIMLKIEQDREDFTTAQQVPDNNVQPPLIQMHQDIDVNGNVAHVDDGM